MRTAIVRRTGLLPLFAALGLVASLVLPAAASESFKIDPSHSRVGFAIRHLVSTVKGEFREVSGTIDVDEANLSQGKVDVTIQAASIFTNNDKRDTHLKSADFFEVEKYPTLRFVSKSISVKDGKGTMAGDLTIKGVTKPVTLDVTVGGFMPGQGGSRVAGFSATGKVDRKDYGITWNRNLDAGGTLLADDVNLEIDVEARTTPKEAPKPAAAAADKK